MIDNKLSLNLRANIGKTYNRLTVLKIYPMQRKPDGRHENRKCQCKCSCGTIKDYVLAGVKNGHTKSCGCHKIEISNTISKARILKFKRAAATHEMSNTKVYAAWLSMKKRCSNESYHGYKNYGGRGIKVCNEWMHSFETFYKHMGNPPEPTHLYSLDRINVNDDYYHGNCKWSTITEQNNNKQRHAKD